MHARHATSGRALTAACLVLALGAGARAGLAPVDWMTYDEAARRVTMTIVAGEGSTNGGWNFNGHAAGGLTVTVPVGWTVEIDFRNRDVLPHSLIVIEGEKPLPVQNGQAAIPRAYTRDLVRGIGLGEGDTLRFTASRAGRYRLFCGVPTHGTSGMWDWLVVSADARVPSVETAAPPGAALSPAPAAGRPKPAALALDGHAWARMTGGEKLRYLEGFLAGHAVRQAVERLGERPVEPADLTAAIEALRREGRLAFPFAPTVYRARLEDFLFYRDRRAMPLHEALAAVGAALGRGGP